MFCTFYLLIKITDSNGKLLFEGEIPSIDKWKEVKKKIKKCTEKCTEQNVVYLVDEVGNYICVDNNIFIIEWVYQWKRKYLLIQMLHLL